MGLLFTGLFENRGNHARRHPKWCCEKFLEPRAHGWNEISSSRNEKHAGCSRYRDTARV
jgi:hypothetical protein